MKKILILFGGDSQEYLISCKSAATITKNIDTSLFDVSTTYIAKDNTWYIYNKDINLIINNTIDLSSLEKITNHIEYLKLFDKVFPIMHGNPCENGNIQGMLNMFNIPYVGSNLQSSIISYDKELTKIICHNYQIPQVPYIVVTNKKAIKKLDIEFPVIIKPAKCGSSIGINIANNIKELNKYIKEAFNYDDKVIIEKYIKSRELECAILEDKKLKVSPVGEIKSSNTFYDYEAKYIKDSNLIIPAKIDKSLEKQIQDLSIKIFKILSLSNLSRIDFLYDYNNDILYFNEVNTMPGFTSISMYPLLFNYIGISTKELITKLINN